MLEVRGKAGGRGGGADTDLKTKTPHDNVGNKIYHGCSEDIASPNMLQQLHGRHWISNSFLLRKFHLTAKLENIRRNPRLERDWIAIGTTPSLSNCPSPSLWCFPFSFLCFWRKYVQNRSRGWHYWDRGWTAIGRRLGLLRMK